MLMRILFRLFILGFVLVPVRAQFDSGSTGEDGAFNPTASTTLTCPEPNCVFNFTTVNVPANVTVSFRQNSFNTPVTIVVQGDVTIAGTVSVAGSIGFRGSEGGAGGLGGPGGFRGGYGGRFDAHRLSGSGLGPGGGAPGSSATLCQDGGGSFGTPGRWNTRPTYGMPTLLPLMGGSGGAGGSCVNCTAYSGPGGGGGGGGGALLLASSTTITVTGIITADGGGPGQSAGDGACWGRSGSGGGIRLIANALTGNGQVRAYGGGEGGDGRIRLESGAPIPTSLQIYPNDPRVRSDLIFTPLEPPSVIVPALPSLQITTLDGVSVPYPLLGQFGASDVTLSTTGPKPVGLAASGIPLGTAVQVTVKPEIGSASVITVTSTPLTGTVESSTATATVELSIVGSYYLEARATFSVAAGAQEAMKVDGEKVKQMRVETALGAGSKVIYVLDSGKQVAAEKASLASSAAKSTHGSRDRNTR